MPFAFDLASKLLDFAELPRPASVVKELAQIESVVSSQQWGTHNGRMQTPTVTQDTTNEYFEIDIVYVQPTDFIFFKGPDVTIRKSKRVYYAT